MTCEQGDKLFKRRKLFGLVGLAAFDREGVNVSPARKRDRTIVDADQIIFKLSFCTRDESISGTFNTISVFLEAAGFSLAYSEQLTSHPDSGMFYDWFIKPQHSSFHVNNLTSLSKLDILLYSRRDNPQTVVEDKALAQSLIKNIKVKICED